MARERMVTRTIDVATIEVMCLDITTAQVSIKNFEVTGKQDKPLLEIAKKVYETDTLKLVAIQKEEHKEVLYGMKEIDFLKYAQVLPPRTSSEE